MAIQQQQQAADLTLLQAIEMVAKDKGIDKTRLVKTVEEAILKAAQSVFGPNRELEARFNEDSGQVDLFQYMTVVDDVSDDDREIAMEDAQRLGLEELGALALVRSQEVRGERVAAELVRIGNAAVAELPELDPPLRNQMIVVVVTHNPCFRLACMNSSRSPSRTAVVLPISTLVRRSLMRD